MLIKQISVFLENRRGRLAEATQILGKREINISALCVADTADYGVLRLIVNKPQEATAALREGGFTVRETDVIAIAINDSPGGLNLVLKTLEEARVSVEYIYAFAMRRHNQNQALAVFKVGNNQDALTALNNSGIEIAKPDEVYQIN